MRINGRILRPSNLEERRILNALGLGIVRIPRSANPFLFCRRVQKLVALNRSALEDLRRLVLPERPTSRPSTSTHA